MINTPSPPAAAVIFASGRKCTPSSERSHGTHGAFSAQPPRSSVGFFFPHRHHHLNQFCNRRRRLLNLHLYRLDYILIHAEAFVCGNSTQQEALDLVGALLEPLHGRDVSPGLVPSPRVAVQPCLEVRYVRRLATTRSGVIVYCRSLAIRGGGRVGYAELISGTGRCRLASQLVLALKLQTPFLDRIGPIRGTVTDLGVLGTGCRIAGYRGIRA